MHEVKRRVIDSFGCALGAWNEEPCAIARKVASDFSAKNGATIIGTASSGAAGLGGLRDRLLHSLFRLQRHLSFERTGASERQYCRGARGGGKRGRERTRSRSPRSRSPMKCNAASATRPAFARAAGIIRPMARSRPRWRRAKLMKLDRGKNAARGQHCGRGLRGDAAGAGRGTFALERRGLRQCGAAWRLLGAARARGNDRAGADFRRPNGIRERTRRFVRQRRRNFRRRPTRRMPAKARRR